MPRPSGQSHTLDKNAREPETMSLQQWSNVRRARSHFNSAFPSYFDFVFIGKMQRANSAVAKWACFSAALVLRIDCGKSFCRNEIVCIFVVANELRVHLPRKCSEFNGASAQQILSISMLCPRFAMDGCGCGNEFWVLNFVRFVWLHNHSDPYAC